MSGWYVETTSDHGVRDPTLGSSVLRWILRGEPFSTHQEEPDTDAYDVDEAEQDGLDTDGMGSERGEARLDHAEAMFEAASEVTTDSDDTAYTRQQIPWLILVGLALFVLGGVAGLLAASAGSDIFDSGATLTAEAEPLSSAEIASRAEHRISLLTWFSELDDGSVQVCSAPFDLLDDGVSLASDMCLSVLDGRPVSEVITEARDLFGVTDEDGAFLPFYLNVWAAVSDDCLADVSEDF